MSKLPIVAISLALLGGIVAPSAATASAPSPLLGSKAFAAPFGEGFGTAEPETIFNGGDPNGLVEEISWSGWGNPASLGRGLGHQFKPHGGYYAAPVSVKLRAKGLGTCPGSKRPAYTKLEAKFQKKPGRNAPFGPWLSWSGAKTICKSP